MKRLDVSGVNMVSDHSYNARRVKRVEIIEKRKRRDHRFFKVEVALLGVSAVLLLNENISWRQMLISGGFAVAALIADVIRRYV